jgi:hypothetical protein
MYIMGASILFTIFWAGVSGAADVSFSLGAKTRIDHWTSTLNHYSSIGDSKMYFDPDKIDSATSSGGFMYGPEMEGWAGIMFVRGFYLKGSSDFNDTGSGYRTMTGMDIGVGIQTVGVFLGQRSLKVDLNGVPGDYLADHTISDKVFGFFVRTSPYKPGYQLGFDMLFGLDLMKSASSTEDENQLKNTSVFEMEMNTGYRFTALPLLVKIGYGLWVYEKPLNEYNTYIYDIRFHHIERIENTIHGGTINVVYTFGPWKIGGQE